MNEAVPTVSSRHALKFGDGKLVYSFQRATIPAIIEGTRCSIETEIVKSDIPLLLNKSLLKKAETVLDLKNDRATLFNQPVNLEFTSSGHYCVKIIKDQHINKNHLSNEEENQEVRENMSKAEKKKIAIKFGHATYDRLAQLLKSAGTTGNESLDILRMVCENCETCIQYKRPVPKPAVGLPLATDFNETVAVDLHELEPGLWYLHVIDEFTRFSAGSIMKSKKSSEFVKKFLECWLSKHGAPKCLYSDNGGNSTMKKFVTWQNILIWK